MPDLFSISEWRNFSTKHGGKFAWTMIIVMGAGLVISFGTGGLGRMSQNSAAAGDDKVIATVNGRPIYGKQYRLLSQNARGQAGEQFAQQQGAALQQLVIQDVVTAEAEKRNLRADDALVDKAIAEEREKLGKEATEEQWRSYVSQIYDMNLNEHREFMAKNMLGAALAEDFKRKINVSDEEAKNQSGEVKLRLMLIRNLEQSMIPPSPKAPRPLPDPEAKKKAEELLAKAKAGANFAELAKQNSSEMMTREKGGETDWRKEYEISQGRGDALGYGEEFDSAVQKTKKGDYTPILKVKGFLPGFLFAQVVDRRNNLPKDFDAKKVADTLKTNRARTQFQEELLKLVDAAKVEVKDPETKTYYDFFQFKQAEQKQMMAQFAGMQGQKQAGKVPTVEEVKKMQAALEPQLEALAKKKPDDPSAALLLASSLKLKRTAAGTTPQQRDAIRERLITLYETGLKGTEDSAIRRELADFYREKKNNDKAAEHYKMISRMLAATPPTDSTSATNAITEHETLEANFRSINKLDLADAERKLRNDLIKVQLDFKMKEAEQKKAQEAAEKKTVPPTINAPKGASPQSATPPVKR
jgi:hypothetical protein